MTEWQDVHKMPPDHGQTCFVATRRGTIIQAQFYGDDQCWLYGNSLPYRRLRLEDGPLWIKVPAPLDAVAKGAAALHAWRMANDAAYARDHEAEVRARQGHTMDGGPPLYPGD